MLMVGVPKWSRVADHLKLTGTLVAEFLDQPAGDTFTLFG